MRQPIQRAGRRDGHQQGWAARVVVNVQRIFSRIGRAIIRRIVVMMVTVMVVVLVTMVMMMVTVTIVSMDMIAGRVGVDEKVRENAGSRPMRHADDGREREQKHHRPHQGDVASARSFQLRQHAF
jgi:hypothetical protein